VEGIPADVRAISVGDMWILSVLGAILYQVKSTGFLKTLFDRFNSNLKDN